LWYNAGKNFDHQAPPGCTSVNKSSPAYSVQFKVVNELEEAFTELIYTPHHRVLQLERGLERRLHTPEQRWVFLTDITLYPEVERSRSCLKKTSAVPHTGGRHNKGLLTCLGPASYTVQGWFDLSTTICKGSWSQTPPQ
jgi:hypothetical protein